MTPEVTAPATRLGMALRALHFFEDLLLTVLLTSLIGLACTQILLRNLLDTGLVWIGPLLRYLVLWVGLLGALCATRSQEHITIDALGRLLQPRLRSLASVLTHGFTAAICGIIALHAVRLVATERELGSLAVGEVPVWIMQCVIPLTFGGMALRFSLRLLLSARDFLRNLSNA